VAIGRRSNPAATENFGWIRVRTEFNGSTSTAFEVLEWAYEDVALESITAGDEVGQIDVPGDYDGNGVVDEGDYGLWAEAFGSTRFPGAGSDGNGNGVVDAADYTVWRDSVESQDAPSIPTPEPSAGGLALLALGYPGVRRLRSHAHRESTRTGLGD